MKPCWEEGELRAHVDRELPPAQALELESHLAGCAACAGAHAAIAERAARVGSWMEDLSAETPATADIPPRGIPRPAVWAGVAALAAALILAVMLSRHSAQQPMQANVALPPAPAPIEAAVAAALPEPPRPTRRIPVRTARRPAAQEYMALDDEPIDTGFVMRMAMPSGILADVIVDGEGRARAIRPITFVKENH